MVLLLGLLLGMGSLAVDMVTPVLPAIAAEFGNDMAGAQQAFGAFFLGFATMQLVYGPFSDRYGRRPVLLVGLGLFAVASLAGLLVTSLGGLIVIRILQGIGACSGPVLARAVVRDRHPAQESARVLSRLLTVMGLIPTVAPLIGGVLHDNFGWRATFAVQAAIGAACFLYILFRLDESNRHLDPRAIHIRHMLGNFATLIRSPIYLGYVLVLFFVFLTLFVYLAAGPFVFMVYLGHSATEFGLLFLISMFGFILGSYLSGRMSGRYTPAALVTGGSVVVIGGTLVLIGLALLGVAHWAAVQFPVMVIFIALSFIIPNAIAGAINPYPRIAGTASSGAGFMQMVSGLLAALLVGHYHDGTPLGMALLMLVGALAMLVAHVFLSRRPAAPAGD
ncbi:MAG: multidrug effflux MFS transporter [Rhodospirillales bacterium]|nr:multidrug effflux MFS transporter [Rhodospirillales bacterium]